MIKLATVFSGIGAIEHALQRMQLEHSIVFACDNGDVEILTKDIGMNIDDIKAELDSLEGMIKDIQFNNEVEDLYKNQLASMLREAISEYNSVHNRLSEIPNYKDNIVKEVLDSILAMEDVKK